MTHRDTFPILYPPGLRRPADAPPSLPWRLVAHYAGQAKQSHGQTLEALASRGGLCPAELVAVLENRSFSPLNQDDAVRRLIALSAAFEAGMVAGLHRQRTPAMVNSPTIQRIRQADENHQVVTVAGEVSFSTPTAANPAHIVHGAPINPPAGSRRKRSGTVPRPRTT